MCVHQFVYKLLCIVHQSYTNAHVYRRVWRTWLAHVHMMHTWINPYIGGLDHLGRHRTEEVRQEEWSCDKNLSNCLQNLICICGLDSAHKGKLHVSCSRTILSSWEQLDTCIPKKKSDIKFWSSPYVISLLSDHSFTTQNGKESTLGNCHVRTQSRSGQESNTNIWVESGRQK